jgi:hypothetical protein
MQVNITFQAKCLSEARRQWPGFSRAENPKSGRPLPTQCPSGPFPFFPFVKRVERRREYGRVTQASAQNENGGW